MAANSLPRLAPGFVRLRVQFAPPRHPTPGDIVRWSEAPPEALGPIAVAAGEAVLDVRHAQLAATRAALARHGQVRVIDWNYRWLRLDLGRIHGLTVGRLRSALQQAGASPLGRYSIGNHYTLVGVRDAQIEAVCQCLAQQRINGRAVHPTVLPPGSGPGPAAYEPRGAPPS
ncbi:MAG: hypothetical protein RMM29_08085 [Planctomycetota bacterium]|nr:hypothetical protein [Planctomycetota bacterium]MCX8039467.1 hypothetical protein [Planctomycetota bacterium]MDW8373585.1 hypothetical protein [Planctomycetota bacterium]